MAVLLKRYALADFTGTAHWGAGDEPYMVTANPGAEVTTAAGDVPTQAIQWDWSGADDSPAGVGAFSTGAERNEKAIGGFSPGPDSVVGWDVWLNFDPITNTATPSSRWNFIFQHRGEEGTSPSPCPTVGLHGSDLYLNLNVVGQQRFYRLGPRSDGSWVHLELLYNWSEFATTGWVMAKFNGAAVLFDGVEKKYLITSRGDDAGATLRWGGGYRDPVVTGPVKYQMWGLCLTNGFAASAPPPTQPGTVPAVPDTDPATRLGVSSGSGSFQPSSADVKRASIFESKERQEVLFGRLLTRGRKTGSGTQGYRLVVFHVVDPADQSTWTLVGVTVDLAIAFDAAAAWSLFGRSGLPQLVLEKDQLYAVGPHTGPNEVVEYGVLVGGQLYGTQDLFSNGPLDPWAANGAATFTDTRGVEVYLGVRPIATPATVPGRSIGRERELATAMGIVADVLVPANEVRHREIGPVKSFRDTEPFHAPSGRRVRWNEVLKGFVIVDT